MALAKIVSQYRFVKCPRTDDPLDLSQTTILLKPRQLILRFEKRLICRAVGNYVEIKISHDDNNLHNTYTQRNILINCSFPICYLQLTGGSYQEAVCCDKMGKCGSVWIILNYSAYLATIVYVIYVFSRHMDQLNNDNFNEWENASKYRGGMITCFVLSSIGIVLLMGRVLCGLGMCGCLGEMMYGNGNDYTLTYDDYDYMTIIVQSVQMLHFIISLVTLFGLTIAAVSVTCNLKEESHRASCQSFFGWGVTFKGIGLQACVSIVWPFYLMLVEVCGESLVWCNCRVDMSSCCRSKVPPQPHILPSISENVIRASRPNLVVSADGRTVTSRIHIRHNSVSNSASRSIQPNTTLTSTTFQNIAQTHPLINSQNRASSSSTSNTSQARSLVSQHRKSLSNNQTTNQSRSTLLSSVVVERSTNRDILKNNAPRRNLTCFTCGVVGHRQNDCTVQIQTEAGKKALAEYRKKQREKDTQSAPSTSRQPSTQQSLRKPGHVVRQPQASSISTTATSQQPSETKETKPQCIICCDHDMEMVLLPCGHAQFCERCVYILMNNDQKCPTCRRDIETFNKYFV